MNMSPLTERFNDTYIVTWKFDEGFTSYVNFEAKKIVARVDGEPVTEWPIAPPTTYEGCIKFDMCMNVNLQESNCMAHFCGPEDFAEFAAFFAWLFKRADELLSK